MAGHGNDRRLQPCGLVAGLVSQVSQIPAPLVRCRERRPGQVAHAAEVGHLISERVWLGRGSVLQSCAAAAAAAAANLQWRANTPGGTVAGATETANVFGDGFAASDLPSAP